jgi:L-methionine (R)-S-oxide reductase
MQDGRAQTDSGLHAWLRAFIERHGGSNGTIHLRNDSDVLALAASHNIPDKVLGIVQAIPKGKGMAGLAWERDQPVSTCNLKTDQTGDVRPGAKAVDAQAAVALPVHDERGDLRAVVGIAFAQERSMSESELAELGRSAEQLPR